MSQIKRSICSLVSNQRYRLGNFYHLFSSQNKTPKSLEFVMQLYAVMVSIQTWQQHGERDEAKWLEQSERVEYHFPGILTFIFPTLTVGTKARYPCAKNLSLHICNMEMILLSQVWGHSMQITAMFRHLTLVKSDQNKCSPIPLLSWKCQKAYAS